ncbi:MAG: BTAD domain-containing putative transcriptional regulator [Pseudomonadota bacterium]
MPSDSSTTALGTGRVMLIGPPMWQQPGKPPSPLPYSKVAALLAILASERKPHSRAVLAEWLWPGESENGRRSLRAALVKLRQILQWPGPSPLETNRHFIQLHPCPPGMLDIDTFLSTAASVDTATARQQAEAALALYRGALLEGLEPTGSEEFEDWLLTRRESLHQHARRLVRAVAQYACNHDTPRQAMEPVQYWLELAPWDEDAHARLMELYAANGETAAALAQFEACRERLSRELGVEPSQELRALRETIHSGGIASHSNAATTPATPPLQSRHLTVMHIELSDTGSPLEEAAERLHRPRQQLDALLRRASAEPLPAPGSGRLLYFGYPEAHEGSAHEAVQLATTIADTFSPLAQGGVICRIGLHSGPVITDGTQPDTTGHTTGVAMHIRRRCPPGEVLVSASTRRRVEGFFTWQDAGELNHSGRTLPLYRPQRAVALSDRLHRKGLPPLPPLQGREQELQWLLEHWRAARGGERRVILLRGEAGIGKSRLAHALLAQASDEGGMPGRMWCRPDNEATPYHSILEMLERIAHIRGLSDPAEREARIEQTLRAAAVEEEDQKLVTALLAHGDDSALQGYSPTRIARALSRATTAIRRHRAAGRPLVSVVEDLHWADPATLDFISEALLYQRTPDLLLLTARPEFEPPWDEGQVATLKLGPLPEGAVQAMLKGLTDETQPLSETMAARITATADGVPLYVEELARMGREEGDIAILPTSLHDLLVARIDRQGEAARRCASIAAVIGREVPRWLLRTVSERLAFDAESGVSRLLHSGLLQTVSAETEQLQFKHALVREAAYSLLVGTERRELHRLVATALEPNADGDPELYGALARHWEAAAEPIQAAQWHLRAGRAAARHGAPREAHSHLQQGLQLLPQALDDPSRHELERELQLSLATTQRAYHCAYTLSGPCGK